MILTTCAACAAPLKHDAPSCNRCETRYCDAYCEADHWRRGHKQMCKKIHRGGNAEQYNADNKYKEAVSVAVEACADDTKGQTCYICTQALHWKTKEGLVRGCACRGTAGFAHVSCLAEQVKILVAKCEAQIVEASDFDPVLENWFRWFRCGLCEQEYHGVVKCALGWACWKTYLGRPEDDWARCFAMTELGNGLSAANHHEDALSVREAELAMHLRLDADADEDYYSDEDDSESLLTVQSNLACSYYHLGRYEESLRLRREVYLKRLKVFRIYGEEDRDLLIEANNLAASLLQRRSFKVAKHLLRKWIPVARRVLGDSNEITLQLRRTYGEALYKNVDATLDDLREAVEALEDVGRIARRVFGSAHPTTASVECALETSRAMLRALWCPRIAVFEEFCEMGGEDESG